MATWQQLIDRARRLWYVDIYQYTDAQAEEDMNIVQEDIANTIITEVWEDFFWDIFTTDLVQNQNEYTLPSNMYKLNWVSILWSSASTEYTKLDTKYPYTEARDISTYENTWDKFYYIADWSVFIYPKPTENIVWWLKLYWIKEINNITKTSAETDILNWRIPTKFHYLIAHWMLEYIYQQRGMLNEANVARNKYLAERSKLVEYLWDRLDVILVWSNPNLDYLSN